MSRQRLCIFPLAPFRFLFWTKRKNKHPCQFVYLSTRLLKKTFFLFLPSHPHKCGSSALFIGVSVVRASVRASGLPSHYPHTYPHTLVSPHTLTLPAESIQLAGDSIDGRQIQWVGREKAALFRRCRYAAPLVQLCCPFGIPMLVRS